MITKAVTYTNFDGEKRTKNLYFHLSKIELARIDNQYDGGVKGFLTKMIETNNNRELFKFFEDFVLLCYGEKSSDGEEFLKNDLIREKFQCHPAYDVFMCQIIQGGDKAMADFINAVIPKDLPKIDVDQANAEAAKILGYDATKTES